MFNGARPGDECDRPPTLGASGVSAFGRLRSTPTRPNGLASLAGAPSAPAERGSIERLVAKGEIATAIAVRAAVRLMRSANLLCVGHKDRMDIRFTFATTAGKFYIYTVCIKSGGIMTKFKKHPGGRPTLYRREYCEQIVDAMAIGLSGEAAAAKIGISARSLFNWQGRHPEFLQAIQEGRQKCLLFWEERAIAIANGEPGNVQMTTLALKNRSRAAYGWHHDSQRVEHSGPDGAPVAIETAARNTIDVSRMSADDRDALRGILLRAGAREESQSKIGYSED
jgi:hypothetical protein